MRKTRFSLKKIGKKILETTIACKESLEPKIPFDASQVNAILFIHKKPLGYGDLIMHSPGIACIKKKFPKAQIDILTDFKPIANNNVFSHIHTTKKELQNKKYDLIILPSKLVSQPFIAKQLSYKWVIGYTRSWKLYANFTHVDFTYNENKHYIELIAHIAESLGIARSEVYKQEIPQIRYDKKSKAKITKLLAKYPKPHIAISPNVAWRSRTYPYDKMQKVAEKLVTQTNGTIFLLGAGNADKYAAQIVKNTHKNIINLVNKTSLVDIATLLDLVDLHITPDTGQMHIGFAQKTPTVALFGPINPAVRMPKSKSKKYTSLWRGDLVNYKTIYSLEEKTTWEECNIIKDISEEEIIKTARKLLK